jgi:ankyrin repeat protein
MWQVVPGPDHFKHFKEPVPTPAVLLPEQLLLNAIQCERGTQHKARLVELLLQHKGDGQGLDLEQVNERGETALHAAVRLGDAQVRSALGDVQVRSALGDAQVRSAI